ncbi:MAG: hypothetical protein V4443_06215 [Pseudomonadota bacterium]
MGRFFKSALIATLTGLWTVSGMAEQITSEQMKAIDERVQDFKKDALRLSAEITQLENKLIYPSSTKVALFIKLAQGDKLRLDAVAIKIDGKNVTRYLYTAKELEALQRGGAQRIATENLRTGNHTIDVDVIGKSGGNSDYHQNSTLQFVKSEGAKLVEITISGTGSGIQSVDD